MPISQMEGYLKNPYFKRTYALSVGFKMEPLQKVFSTSTEMMKEATIHLFLIDESHFSNICTL